MSLIRTAAFITFLVLPLASFPQTPPDSPELVAIKRTDPVYPQAASRDERQGQVIVRVHISETGTVEDATVVSGDPVFQSAAIESMKKWSFQPYIRNGKPIRVITDFPVSFVAQSRVKEFPERVSLPKVELEPAPGAGSESLSKSPGGVKIISPPDVRVPKADLKTLLIRMVYPIYPYAAKRERIQGSVVLNATIRLDGFVGDITPVSGPSELVQSATDAVSLWHYRRFTLNGKPTPVQIVVQVNYTLSGG